MLGILHRSLILMGRKSGSSSSIWTRSKKGRLKLNFDGSSKSGSSSVGGVYRDHNGKFVLGYAERIGEATSSVAELAVENGWRDISVEGDFKLVVDVIKNRAVFRPKEDAKQCTEIAVLLRRVGKVAVSHVLRTWNKVAHGFAKLGHKAAAQRLWRDVPPDEVLVHLRRDANSKGK